MPDHTSTMSRTEASRELLAELAALDEGRAMALPGTTWAGIRDLPTPTPDEGPVASAHLPSPWSPVADRETGPVTLPDVVRFTAHAPVRRWGRRRAGRD